MYPHCVPKIAYCKTSKFPIKICLKQSQIYLVEIAVKIQNLLIHNIFVDKTYTA